MSKNKSLLSKTSTYFIGATFAILVLALLLPLIPTPQANRTESVFVYGTLLNPWVRAYTCYCRTKATPTELTGYRKEGLNIAPDSNNTVSGALIKVDEVELKNLDEYEKVPSKYRREKITIDNQEHWVYIKNQ